MENIISTSEGARRLEDLVKQVDLSSQKVEELQKQIFEEHENIQRAKDIPYQDKINEIEDVLYSLSFFIFIFNFILNIYYLLLYLLNVYY